ncbi:hypothetical protein N6H14_28990 [Paenibacillus sp. CC-CFT747]|nr:hypothetical protein N6H14_28990 [Paenibacillus sp. CC-CFT747]
MFRQAAGQWEKVFNRHIPLPVGLTAGGSWAEWTAWLGRVRAEMQAGGPAADYSQEVQASIWSAAGIVRQELQEDLSLPETARRVNMSRSYFSKCFRTLPG